MPPLLYTWPVRVPIDLNGRMIIRKSRSRDMCDGESIAAELKIQPFRQAPAQRRPVHVAADSIDRRQPLQLPQNGLFSDIARMDDTFDIGEQLENLGRQNAVRVGNYSNVQPVCHASELFDETDAHIFLQHSRNLDDAFIRLIIL